MFPGSTVDQDALLLLVFLQSATLVLTWLKK